MGLADLKKNATRSDADKLFQVSADDFIEEASLYAMGRTSKTMTDNIICFREHQAQNESAVAELGQIIEQTTARVQQGREKGPFRKATFSLTESAWQHLAILAKETETAKSRLIRNMIERDFGLSEPQATKG